MSVSSQRPWREKRGPRLGIFAKTFPRPNLESVFASVAALSLDQIQFNFACAGLPSLPEQKPSESLLQSIQRAAKRHGVSIAGLSGTFNMIHPNHATRAEQFRRFDLLLDTCRALDVTIVTLCTGTRDPHDMWRPHPDNQSVEAWKDLVTGLEKVLPKAESIGVILAVEPEMGNVIHSADAAHRLLKEIKSPNLKVILDPANIFFDAEHATRAMGPMIERAMDTLRPDLVMAHAKELDQDRHAGGLGLGQGMLDWDGYLQGLVSSGYDGPVVMHGFAEADAASSTAFLRDKLNSLKNN